MRWLMGVSMLLFSITSSAVDYEKEVLDEIIRPCYLQHWKSSNTPKDANALSDEEAVELMMILSRDKTEKLLKTVVPLLSGLSGKERDTIYELGLRICLKQ